MKFKPKSLHRLVVALTFTASILLCTTTNAAITSTGDVSPANPDSWNSGTLAYIGNTGVGSIEADGGSDITNDITSVGTTAAGDGTVLITGTGSSWTFDIGYIGDSGKGSVSIEDGATWSTLITYIGMSSGSNGALIITDTGSSWANTSVLYIGYEGMGILDIKNGATATTTEAYIGTLAGGSGGVAIYGTGSTWTITGGLVVGSAGTGALYLQEGGCIVIGRDLQIDDTNGTFNWTGGTLEINGDGGGVTNENLTVPNGGLLTGTSPYTTGTTQIVVHGGQTQFTGGPLYTSEGAGYTITGDVDYTLATATYNVQLGGTLKKENLWEVTAADSVASFVFDADFAFSTDGFFSTLSDCTGADALNFGASTGGTININHQATIASLNATSTAAFVIGTGGKLASTTALDMRNASGVTINIAAGDFAAGRTITELGASTWIIDPTKVTLNIASPTGAGTVTIATSTGTKAVTTDGTSEVSQSDLDNWIAGYSGSYTIGYDGFDLLSITILRHQVPRMRLLLKT